jgi:hypothetical protein
MTERYAIQVVTAIQSGDGGTELTFQDGSVAAVAAMHPDYDFLLIEARWSVDTGRPVGLILDERGVVLDLNHTWDSSVRRIRDDPEDSSRLEVGFWGYSPVCYLTRDHPDFERIRATLAEAAAAGTMVWLANRSHMVEGETEIWHKLMDVRPISAVVFTPKLGVGDRRRRFRGRGAGWGKACREGAGLCAGGQERLTGQGERPVPLPTGSLTGSRGDSC